MEIDEKIERIEEDIMALFKLNNDNLKMNVDSACEIAKLKIEIGTLREQNKILTDYIKEMDQHIKNLQEINDERFTKIAMYLDQRNGNVSKNSSVVKHYWKK